MRENNSLSFFMKVTYLFNSGFVVELEKHILIFDYFKGAIDHLDPHKKVYVFSSHRHKDHYNPDIFNFKHPSITYILSDDIDHDGFKVKPHQTYHIDELTIQTLLSTDEGVAFVVNVENKMIYHAGDLNWWNWEGEPQDFLDDQERIFKQEINSIKDIHFDIMMIPLDIRLENHASDGMNYILSHMKPHYVFPMHCFSHHKEMSQLLDLPPLNQYSIFKIEKRHQIWTLN